MSLELCVFFQFLILDHSLDLHVLSLTLLMPQMSDPCIKIDSLRKIQHTSICFDGSI